MCIVATKYFPLLGKVTSMSVQFVGLNMLPLFVKSSKFHFKIIVINYTNTNIHWW